MFKLPLFKDHLKDSFKVVENVFNCSSVAKSDDHSLQSFISRGCICQISDVSNCYNKNKLMGSVIICNNMLQEQKIRG